MQTNRTLWVIAIIVLAGGFVGGYAMSGSKPAPRDTRGTPAPRGNSATSPQQAKLSTSQTEPGGKHFAGAQPAGLAAVVHRFPLTSADVKESMESAAVAVTDDGVVHLAWASRTSPDEWQVFLTRSVDRGGSFDDPRVVARSAVHRVTSQSRGKTITREVRMMPRLVGRAGDLYLGWVEAVEDNTAVKFFVARSQDGGKTFASPAVASLTAGARPTYTSLAVGADGALAASWLDNRQKVQLPAAAVGSVENGFESDQLAYIPESGGGVCPCCPTNLAIGDDGSVYLAFRNQQDGFRDMWISRLEPGAKQFDPPRPVVSPTWKFDGCPHDGPSLVVQGNRLHIAWMDARSGQPQVYLAQGTTTMDDFQVQAIAPEGLHSQGHPSLAAGPQGLHLAWDEGSGQVSQKVSTTARSALESEHQHGSATSAGETSRVIRYASFLSSGEQAAEPQAVAPVEGGFQTRPAIALHPAGEIYVGWVELTPQGKSIAIARLENVRAKAAVAQETNR